MGRALALAALLGLLPAGATARPADVPFDHAVIHPGAIGIRALGDVDGDGLLDVVARNNDPGGGLPSLVWYRHPGWERHVIRGPENSRCDEIALADVDGDGDLDLVMALDEPGRVHWVANPRPDGDPTAPWPAAVQVGVTDDGGGGLSYVKDLEVADLTGDGRPDIAARTNREVFVFGQVEGGGGPGSAAGWRLAARIDIPDHEGMASGDLDGDGDVDLVVNGLWIETPGGASPAGAAWTVREIDRRWFTQSGGGWQDNNAKVAVADVDGNGRPDVLTCHSEHEGYPVLWYEAADPRAGPWIAHEILARFDYCHTLQAADFDADGDLDVLVAQMPKSADPDEIVLLSNEGGGRSWARQLVGTTGMYSGVAGDLGADGDVDIVGCRSWDAAPIEWWENRTVDPAGRPPEPATATPRPRPTPGPPGPRTREGLLAEYRFDEAAGGVAHDTAGSSPSLDLHVADPAAVRWQAGALAVVGPTRLRTSGPADRLTAAIRRTGALSIEAWIAPASVDQEGPARIVSLSLDSETRNITLGQGLWGDQPRDVFDVRLRTSATDANGTGSLTTPSGAARVALQHVVFVRSADGARALWVDGVPVATGHLGGDLGTWADGMPLVLANEDQVDRPWLGTLYHVALYDRALGGDEIEGHFALGPDDAPPAQATRPTATVTPAPSATAAATPASTSRPTVGSGSGRTRVYLPIAQHRAPAPDVAHAGLERVARVLDLPLGGVGLGVPETRHSALDVEGGRVYLLGPEDADGVPLVAFESGASERISRHPIGRAAIALHVAGNHVYVVDSQSRVGDAEHAMVRAYEHDASGTPRLLGQAALDEVPERHALAGSALYALHQERLFVVDLANPSQPREAGDLAIGFRPHDIAASDAGIVYVADEERITVVDARDPEAPRRVAERSGFDRLRAVRVTADGRHVIAFEEVRVRSFVADGVLTVFDAQEPAALRPIGRLTIDSVRAWGAGLIRDFGPILVSLDGDHLAIAAHELAVVDLTVREAPRLLRRGTLPRRALGLVSEGGTIVVAQDDGAIEAFRVR